MANFWTVNNNITFAELQERRTVDLTLPLTNSEYTVTKIAGDLPRGLRLDQNKIVGTPLEVPRLTTYKFVLRASDGTNISDITLNITVEGEDAPTWVTDEDLLPLGNNRTFFVLDNEIVDFQLEAIDSDTSTGQKLEYYIGSKDGELPPGLTLTTDGKIVGVVDPVLAITKESGAGNFDDGPYDIAGGAGYDFGIRSGNGFQSYFYDTTVFDYSETTRSPRKLNRYYEFIVNVDDGDNIARRKFRIYVVGDDFLRVDNTILQVGSGTFRADNTHIRTPIWITPADLGYKRANNYVTLILDVINPNTLKGVVSYSLEETNDDGSASVLPDGLKLDSTTGEIGGYVPYQPAVTKEFKFTIKALRQSVGDETAESKKTFTVKILGEVDSTIAYTTPANLGTISSNYISTLSVVATTTVPNATMLYNLKSGKLPPGLSLKFDGEIVGKINSFGTTDNPGLTVFDNNDFSLDGNTTTVDRVFKFTVTAQDQFGFSRIDREFTLRVTDPDDKLYSNLFFKPLMPREERKTFRDFMNNGEIFTPEYIYRPNDPNFGLQQEIKMLVYAGIETKTADYYVGAAAKNNKRKKYKVGPLKTAIAKKPGTNDVIYEVVYLEVLDPYMPKKGKTKKSFNIRNKDRNLINQILFDERSKDYDADLSTFDVAARLGDITISYGDGLDIYTRDYFISTPTGASIPVETRAGIVEVTLTKRGEPISKKHKPDPINTIRIDSDAITIDGANDQVRYISNLQHARDNIRAIGETEKNFLPLWMRTPQDNSVKELGYVFAVPLVYTKPGKSAIIKNAIEFYQSQTDFDFKDYTLDIDRYVLDSSTGISEEKYIVFQNYKYNV